MADVMKVRAYAKGIDQTPRKVSLVAGLVRRRSVKDALTILSYTPKRAAKPVAKAIESAKANAIHNHGLDGETLSISILSVTSGSRLKRYKTAGRGRVHPFEKKTSNILVEVTGNIKPKKATTTSTKLKAKEKK